MTGPVRRSVWIIFALGCSTGAAASADTAFFPPRAFVLEDAPDHQNDISGLLADRYSDALRRMNEPSLWKASQSDRKLTAYRFLWLPTWGRPVAVRIEKAGGRATLHMVQLDGSGGYDLGKIDTTRRMSPNRDDWERLMRRVRTAGFWGMPSRIDRLGADGEELIVEGVKDGRYHVVDRWTPEAGAYLELCRTLLDLSGMDLGQKEWPAPPPSDMRTWLLVILSGLTVSALSGAFLLRVLRRRKPRPDAGLNGLE
jgi:hypothetical protein